MRVSDSNYSSVISQSLMNNSIKLNKVTEQLGSSLRINHFSDDPLASVKVENLNKHLALNEKYNSNAENVMSNYQRYETYMNSMQDIGNEINKLLLTGKNGTLDDESRLGVVSELKSLQEEMVTILNKQENGSYIFSGTAVDKPAVTAGSDYTIIGNNLQRESTIGEGQKVSSNFTVEDALGNLDFLNDLTKAIGELETESPNFIATLDTALNSNQDAIGNLQKGISNIGSQYSSVERISGTNKDVSTFTQAMKDNLTALDVADANIRLNQHLVALQTTQKAFTMIQGNSLFDLL
ncbi:flagellar hook-associated protein 3 [Vibrio sp. S17_S38]|uniref:flagellin N-terminal helical domain-containing protein n=1 Tax=Vibrio sp. S17_S38 TaxID=2720229 RepID=UPI0016804A45|nr:flagellar hook-associated protein 3 [Vibrio sp. S17_S38]MBD1573430.1 flagellar hook-associated protein 3 [Vibrio sp. S17_S38]